MLVGLVGLCFAEVGSRVASPGGLYGYASESFGPVVGGIAGTLLWVANSVVPNAAVANLLVDTFTMAVPAAGAWRGAWFAAIYALLADNAQARCERLFCGDLRALAVVNIRGARSGVRLSATLAVIKIAPLVLLVAAGLFAVHPVNLYWTGMPAAATIGRAAVLLFFAFMGVEGALNTSGEVADPARTVPRNHFADFDASGHSLHRPPARGAGRDRPGARRRKRAARGDRDGRIRSMGHTDADRGDGPVGGGLSLR